MRRIISAIPASITVILALVASLHLVGVGAPDHTRISQNITVGFLEQQLVTLKANGQEPQSATICTVDWEKYGIVVRLNCKTMRTGFVGQSTALKNIDPTKQDGGIEIDGVAFIDCTAPNVIDAGQCAQMELQTYNANLAAPWEVSAGDICEAVLRVLHLKVQRDGNTCPESDDFSELKVTDTLSVPEKGSSGGDGLLYILATKDSSAPPVFSVSVVSTPAVLDNMGRDDYFERIDFLLFWTYEQNGEFDVTVEPVFILQGTLSSDIDQLIGVKASARLSPTFVGIRQTLSRPTVVANAIASSTRSFTATVRDHLLPSISPI